MTDHEKVRELILSKEQAPIALDATRSALIVVDVQRFFASPDSSLAQVFGRVAPGMMDGYFERVRSAVLPNIQRLQQCFRSQKRPVIFCSFGSFMEDGQDLPTWLKDFDQLCLGVLGHRGNPQVNDSSWRVEETVAPQPGELVINKNTSGPLNSTKLDQILKNAGINSLVVCGLTTAVCVTQTAREAADRGFRVLIAEEACTEMSVEMHDAALLAFRYVFGQVRKTEEVIDFLTTPASTTANLTAA
jgi:nicotinamidase-related amidase